MPFSEYKNSFRWVIIFVSFVIISLILWNTYIFFQNFKAEERTKMEIWTAAQKELNKSDNLESDIGELPLIVLRSNTTTPMILTDANDKITGHLNIPEKEMTDSASAKALLLKFKTENEPFVFTSDGEVLSKLYYGNSPQLNKLMYYPLALLLIIFLFAAVVYFFYKSSKNATQNKLWSGMAKETAHQIGTPLSSLIGWVELLKLENVNPEYLDEIITDVDRLKNISHRFSKIGSIPELKKVNIIEVTKESFEYLEHRSSKLVNFDFIAPEKPVYVQLNTPLYSWTIENLVKNAIDAMKGKGKVTIKIIPNKTVVKVQVSDTGKGMPKSSFKKIFEPGYTTKKRGWGLGLSLARRIVEDYHQGKIKVLNSELSKGSTLQISLKTL
jgi:two-component system, sporulation sensor kinase D